MCVYVYKGDFGRNIVTLAEGEKTLPIAKLLESLYCLRLLSRSYRCKFKQTVNDVNAEVPDVNSQTVNLRPMLPNGILLKWARVCNLVY